MENESKPICPITQDIILYGCLCSDNYIYEEKYIKEWIELGKTKSPISRCKILYVLPINDLSNVTYLNLMEETKKNT